MIDMFVLQYVCTTITSKANVQLKLSCANSCVYRSCEDIERNKILQDSLNIKNELA